MKKLCIGMLLVFTLFFVCILQSQEKIVSGKILDATTSQPIIGAALVIKNSKIGTSTDFDGQFSIKVEVGDVLTITSLGYKTAEVTVGQEEKLRILLKSDISELDKIVVVGYGTQTKESLTGAVSQISSEALESRPVANAGQALQGLIPNLNITIPSGALNVTPRINIRGGTTFTYDDNKKRYTFVTGSPLVLIDGIPGDINLLNPDDIKSVTVLKDAASSAVYGARGAYGVVLVTTKKGKNNEKPKVSYTSSIQWNSPSNTPNLLDAYTIQLASMKALELENKTPSSDMQQKLNRIKAHIDNPEKEPIYYMSPGGDIIWIGNTRVYDEAVKSSTPMVKHNLSVRGGGLKNYYYASFGFQNQDGLYKLNTDNFKRYNALLNISTKATDWLYLDYGVQYNSTVFKEPVSPAGKGGWWRAMSQEPGRNINMPVRAPGYSPAPGVYTDNILSFMDYGSSNKVNKELLTLSITPTIKLLKDWKIKNSFAYKSYNFKRKQVIPSHERIERRWDSRTTIHTDPSRVEKWNSHYNQYILNLWSDYKFALGEHNFYAMAGFNQEWYVYESLYGKGEELLTPNIPAIDQTLGNEFVDDVESHWALRGGFYRVTYNFDNRYYLKSDGRYDGTSRFPKNSRFKFFPSVSAAWRISEEKFVEFTKPVLNQLKFRVSYGSLGNQNISSFYPYILSYGTISQVGHLFDGQRPFGVLPPGLVDSNLTWETASTLDFGVDIRLFNKLNLTFDWYKRKTIDILVTGDKLPAVLGATPPNKNSGELETIGWELIANWKDQLQNGLRYDINFTLSDYQTEVSSFGGNPNGIVSVLYQGRKMGEIWGYETHGLFQTQREIDTAPDQSLLNSNWFPGDVRYKDLNGDGEISPGSNTLEDPGDRKIIGNSTPRYQFGFNLNIAWKSFDFNLFLQGVAKRDFWISDSMFWGVIAGGTGTWEVYDNSWTPERTDAFYPAYKNKGANRLAQTRYLHNASYTRLKNIALGYSLPIYIAERINISKLRLYLSGYNLWEYTQVPSIFNPENMSANYPLLRSIAIGLQVTF
ncbi:MAG: SusC/RagA family TonB-linked outer membrane protein [Tenacibaculum sp.]